MLGDEHHEVVLRQPTPPVAHPAVDDELAEKILAGLSTQLVHDLAPFPGPVLGVEHPADVTFVQHGTHSPHPDESAAGAARTTNLRGYETLHGRSVGWVGKSREGTVPTGRDEGFSLDHRVGQTAYGVTPDGMASVVVQVSHRATIHHCPHAVWAVVERPNVATLLAAFGLTAPGPDESAAIAPPQGAVVGALLVATVGEGVRASKWKFRLKTVTVTERHRPPQNLSVAEEIAGLRQIWAGTVIANQDT